jgi:hypothetical protein
LDHETITTLGIHQLTFDPDRGLLVNGQAPTLKNLRRHQDAGSYGKPAGNSQDQISPAPRIQVNNSSALLP